VAQFQDGDDTNREGLLFYDGDATVQADLSGDLGRVHVCREDHWEDTSSRQGFKFGVYTLPGQHGLEIATSEDSSGVAREVYDGKDTGRDPGRRKVRANRSTLHQAGARTETGVITSAIFRPVRCSSPAAACSAMAPLRMNQPTRASHRPAASRPARRAHRLVRSGCECRAR